MLHDTRFIRECTQVQVANKRVGVLLREYSTVYTIQYMRYIFSPRACDSCKSCIGYNTLCTLQTFAARSDLFYIHNMSIFWSRQCTVVAMAGFSPRRAQTTRLFDRCLPCSCPALCSGSRLCFLSLSLSLSLSLLYLFL